MQGAEHEANEIAERLSLKVVGHHRTIAQVAQRIVQWQEEPAPRFPLRLLFTGPTSVGKQLLGSGISDVFFNGRFAVHWGGHSGPLRANHKLRTLGDGPLVLFFKMFDDGAEELATVETLLTSGGIILGNGRSMALADSIVILSASHRFSAELEDAARDDPSDGWARALAARFPWVANGIDGAFRLEKLGTAELAEVVVQTAAVLSERAGIAIAVTDAAALAVAKDRYARNIDDALAAEVAKVLVNSKERAQLEAEGRTLLVDHADGGFRMLSMAAGTPLPEHSFAVRATPADVESPNNFCFKPKPRPRKFPALNWIGKWEYDAFISYKIRKHLSDARRLRDELTRLRYKVWLDEDQIGPADDPSYTKSKQQLIDHLVRGVVGSHCTIVYEARLEAVALPPGWSKADAESTGSVMGINSGGLIAWNWQKLEIDSSSHTVVIREGRPHVSIVDGAHDITKKVLGAEEISPDKLVAAIARAIDYFRNDST